MNTTVYGIPNCDTVKKARAWLVDRGVDHTFVDFRATPVAPARVAAWVQALGAGALKNTSGGSYRSLPADKGTWDDATWTQRFAQDPMLIKRPVIEREGVAVLAGFKDPAALGL